MSRTTATNLPSSRTLVPAHIILPTHLFLLKLSRLQTHTRTLPTNTTTLEPGFRPPLAYQAAATSKQATRMIATTEGMNESLAASNRGYGAAAAEDSDEESVAAPPPTKKQKLIKAGLLLGLVAVIVYVILDYTVSGRETQQAQRVWATACETQLSHQLSICCQASAAVLPV